uniref:Venom peptide Os5a n=1 Tax=Oncocephalus sp. TaxID=2944721 RepID=A0AB38ZES2_9HEMI
MDPNPFFRLFPLLFFFFFIQMQAIIKSSSLENMAILVKNTEKKKTTLHLQKLENVLALYGTNTVFV